MSLQQTLDLAAAQATGILDGAGSVRTDERWPWLNVIVTGRLIGRAHVERYSRDPLEVLHVTVFPPPGSARPIFGADLVGTPKGVSLMAWDWSPTAPRGPVPPALPPLCGRMRKLPAWADQIMSRHAVAIRPQTDEDVRTFLAFVVASLHDYLDTPLGEGDPFPAIRRHAMAQRSNPYLVGTLTAHHGHDVAQRFIREVLWPMPEDVWPVEAAT